MSGCIEKYISLVKMYKKICNRKIELKKKIISTTCNSRSIIFYPPTYIIIYYDLELLDLHIPFSIHIHLLIRSDIGIPFVCTIRVPQCTTEMDKYRNRNFG